MQQSQVVVGDVQRAGQDGRCRRHQLQLPIDVFGQIGRDLFGAPLELFALAMGIEGDQHSHRQQGRHDETGAIDQQQCRQPPSASQAMALLRSPSGF
jgi:hypothetical protein